MPRTIDLTGQKFGRLTVIKNAGRDKYRQAVWLCECDCGNTSVVNGGDLRSGNTKSCGCLNREKVSSRRKTHGLSKTRLHRIWRGMRSRCFLQSMPKYKNYGERGIVVCEEWRDNFQAFYEWAMANGYREDLTIDRIDVDGNYEPSNCRWITISENSKKEWEDRRKKL